VSTPAPTEGDGVISLSPVESPMSDSADISPNVANLMITESAANLQASNRNSRGVFDAVMGALAGTVQTNFAEVGVLEGRSVSGVLGTPLASPTVKTV
jgi:hypothetical protein